MSKKRRKTFFLVILASCALAAFIGHTIAQRMQQHLLKLDQQIEEMQREYDTVNKELADNEVYAQKWNEISGFQDQAVEDIQNDFTAYLQRLAPDPDFFTNLGSPEAVPWPGWGEFQLLKCKLTFTRGLEDVVDFLARLDSADELLRVESLLINRKESRRSLYSYGLSHFERDYESPEALTVTMIVTMPAGPAPETPAFGEEQPGLIRP